MICLRYIKNWLCNNSQSELNNKQLEITKLRDSMLNNQAMISVLIEDELLYKLTIEQLKKDLSSSKFKHAITSVSELFNEEDLKPTQSDKPSAHSSLTMQEAMTKFNQVFPKTKYQLITVQNTNSMEPFIDANSLIVGERLTTKIKRQQPLVIGDICIYKGIIRGKEVLIIHRIIKVNERLMLYRFRGDNNFDADPWVKEENIIYRYVAQIQTRQILEGD